MDETRFDPRRRLCPDGACIGLIGPDGLCKVCGRPASGMAALPAEPAGGVDAGDGGGGGGGEVGGGGDNDGERDSLGESNGHEAAGGDGGDFDTKRRLCDDGSCVGVVGADGLCRVCGRRAEG